MKRSCTSILLSFLILFIPVFGKTSEGFPKGTPIKTPKKGVVPIETLKKSEKVVAYDPEKKEFVECEVVDAKKELAAKLLCILCAQEKVKGGKSPKKHKIFTGRDHKFYLPRQKKWVEAYKLLVGQYLLGANKRELKIEDIKELYKKTTLYDLSIKKLHNYCISDDGIVVHNFAQVIPVIGYIGTAGEASAIFAAAGKVAVSTGIAMAAFFGFKGFKDRQKQKGERISRPGDMSDQQTRNSEKSVVADKGKGKWIPLKDNPSLYRYVSNDSAKKCSTDDDETNSFFSFFKKKKKKESKESNRKQVKSCSGGGAPPPGGPGGPWDPKDPKKNKFKKQRKNKPDKKNLKSKAEERKHEIEHKGLVSQKQYEFSEVRNLIFNDPAYKDLDWSRSVPHTSDVGDHVKKVVGIACPDKTHGEVVVRVDYDKRLEAHVHVRDTRLGKANTIERVYRIKGGRDAAYSLIKKYNSTTSLERARRVLIEKGAEAGPNLTRLEEVKWAQENFWKQNNLRRVFKPDYKPQFKRSVSRPSFVESRVKTGKVFATGGTAASCKFSKLKASSVNKCSNNVSKPVVLGKPLKKGIFLGSKGAYIGPISKKPIHIGRSLPVTKPIVLGARSSQSRSRSNKKTIFIGSHKGKASTNRSRFTSRAPYSSGARTRLISAGSRRGYSGGARPRLGRSSMQRSRRF